MSVCKLLYMSVWELLCLYESYICLYESYICLYESYYVCMRVIYVCMRVIMSVWELLCLYESYICLYESYYVCMRVTMSVWELLCLYESCILVPVGPHAENPEEGEGLSFFRSLQHEQLRQDCYRLQIFSKISALAHLLQTVTIERILRICAEVGGGKGNI